MKYDYLGKTGIKVSRLCFGTLTISPLQRNFSPERGGELISFAADLGVNFLDTAEIYDTYPHIAYALKRHPDLVVSTKSYAYDKQSAQKSVEKAMREIGRDYIDIFLMHEQESYHTIRGHYEALEYYISMKEKGYIGAVGLSTHFAPCVEAACLFPEIDIVHPILNKDGYGVMGGTREDMVNNVQSAYRMGKGIFAMKPFGGGNLLADRKEALEYILSFPYLHSVATGMQTKQEVLYNVKAFSGEGISDELDRETISREKHLMIHDWCQGCGRCVERCKNGALSLQDGHAVVDKNKCVTCGYCGAVCPEFAIKIV